MNRHQFEREREQDWKRFDKLLTKLEKRRKGPRARGSEALPALYRQICQDLSLAKHRLYGSVLIERLNRLAMRGYFQLYRPRLRFLTALVRYISVDFPRAVRANGRLFWACMGLFWIPFFGMIVAAEVAPEWVYAMVDQDMEGKIEDMYGPGTERVGRHPDAATNLAGFAFYIRNNIGIDFRTFAGGIAFGLGTIFFMVYNGLFLGAVFGHINRVGYTDSFYPFVSGHGSFELMAIVICGMAGLKIGLALVMPGRMTRSQALRVRGREGLHLLFGGVLMTFTAAFVESFWSPSGATPMTKYIVGAMLWVLVLAYFLFAGRRHAHQ